MNSSNLLEIFEWIYGGELNHRDLRPEFDIFLTQGKCTETALFTPLFRPTLLLVVFVEGEYTDFAGRKYRLQIRRLPLLNPSETSLMGLYWA